MLASWVEKPPMATVEKAWHTASNNSQTLARISDVNVPMLANLSDTTNTQLQQSIWLYRGLLGGQLGYRDAVEEAAFEFDRLADLVRDIDDP